MRPTPVSQRWLMVRLPLGPVFSAWSPRNALTLPAIVLSSSKSNGRRRCTSTTPAMPPSWKCAPVVLYTSTLRSNSAGTSANSMSRPTVVKTLRPSSVVMTFGRPRTSTWPTSPPARATCTPVTRCRAAATLLSGSLPMSSATIESLISLCACLVEMALSTLLRTPRTCTASSVEVGCAVAGCAAAVPSGAASWACAPALSSSVIDNANGWRIARLQCAGNPQIRGVMTFS